MTWSATARTSALLALLWGLQTRSVLRGDGANEPSSITWTAHIAVLSSRPYHVFMSYLLNSALTDTSWAAHSTRTRTATGWPFSQDQQGCKEPPTKAACSKKVQQEGHVHLFSKSTVPLATNLTYFLRNNYWRMEVINTGGIHGKFIWAHILFKYWRWVIVTH